LKPIKELKVIEECWKLVKNKKNVIGYSGKIMPKIINNKITKIPCIRIYVTKKEPLHRLEKKDVIPSKFAEFRTDVVEIKTPIYLEKHVIGTTNLNHRKRRRSVIAGISCTHINSTACTLTYFFKKGRKEYIALNNHCGGLSNKAKKGDYWLQPSPYDGGIKSDVIALYSFNVPSNYASYHCKFRNFFHRFRAIKPNYVDIAFGEPTTEFELSILGNNYTISEYGSHIRGQRIVASGRTSGIRAGYIFDPYWNGMIRSHRGTLFYKTVY